MNLALHDRLGDLQRNFVYGREMIELATCVLKSHVQSCGSAQHPPQDDVRSTVSCGTVCQSAFNARDMQCVCIAYTKKLPSIEVGLTA